jgi:cellulose 1,4-beta-cellobiosidase
VVLVRASIGAGIFFVGACCAAPAPAPRAGQTLGEVRAGANPFDGARFYVNPEYVAKVEASAANAAGDAERLRKVEAFPTAIWLSSIDRARRAARYLDDGLSLQERTGQPVVTVFVLYDVPGRDCAAAASSGELALMGGEERYRTEFIDAIAVQFRAHASQRIVAVIEPDSLANVVTNLDVGNCRAADPVYRRSVAYAVRALSMPHVSLYLDAAHAGWLGWDGSRGKIARIFREVLDEAGGVDRIRGFSTNVSNFGTLSDADGRRLEPSDPCPDELTYVEKLTASLAEAGIAGKGFIVDTSRNGRGGIRPKPGAWCNILGAGLGERPRSSPAPGVDAYYWIKPPGESDGSSDPASAGFDPACTRDGSAPGAPPAGAWFASYFADLVRNANPPL